MAGKISSLLGEANKIFKAEAEQRKAAAESPKSIILHTKDLQGEYDPGRLLYTTIGGVARPITSDDLAAFRHNVRIAQAKFKGGIKARQVLDMSLQVDRDRAQKEIRMAVPVSAKNGLVRFSTNAGPDSKVSRHHVNVQFLSFGAAASSGRDTAQKMANWMRKQPLKFDCDCGRHKFWFRYISTIGDFNAGRAETGFPKVRNPGLHGVACKHVLRVMAEVESSGTVLGFLTRLIDKAQASDDAKAQHTAKVKEIEAQVAKQNARARDIQTTESRAKARAVAKAKKALTEAARAAPEPKKAAASTRRSSPQKATNSGINTSTLTPGQLAMAKQFGMTPEQVMALISA